MDTADPNRNQMLDLLRGLSPSQRLMRALALSALVRDLAWQGAKQHAGHQGADAVIDRFLRQLYGPEIAARFAARL